MLTSTERAPPLPLPRDQLLGLAQTAAPVTLAAERRLPVLPALESLLPDRGLRRGSVVAVAGSTALVLALAAGPSRAGAYLGVVNEPDLGLVAAAELGVVLDRTALVPDPGRSWLPVVAALLDGVGVVIVRPPQPPLPPAAAGALGARARDRGAVLLVIGGWAGADLRLTAGRQAWEGLRCGDGHLHARRLEVAVDGRHGAQPRTAWLWLPDRHGQVRLQANHQPRRRHRAAAAGRRGHLDRLA